MRDVRVSGWRDLASTELIAFSRVKARRDLIEKRSQYASMPALHSHPHR